ncbi:phage antirepressor N-terminal domain-containing protein [Pseudomonas sp. Choline-02u-1]|uniref:phage antirepressor N-terminal domain-containing protein n=1 Tax=Pseudomonas sp. Choline-02u-1 TaxID=2058307 RepID=UPI002114F172|nr:phage antirepressor N-terminal domain-containing protein [Pseudomonas sp. Choline-02u-1]
MKKPQCGNTEASENEINFEEEIVMSNISTAVSNVIPFRSASLLLVEKGGEPFVPMKPVVEGMGLAWQAQHAKLTSGRFNSVITMIVTTGVDGKQYEMSCLPLRKLPGWLMSIHASKVRPELRECVIAFQNECDDVLWLHWNKIHAPVELAANTNYTLIGTTIGSDGFHCLSAVIDGKISRLDKRAKQSARMHIWSQVHKAFSVVRGEDIPAEKLESAMNFVAAYAIEGQYLPKPAEPYFDVGQDGRYMLSFNHKGEQQITRIPDDAYVLSSREFLKGIAHIPGDIPISTDDLFEFALAALSNLRLRSKHRAA